MAITKPDMKFIWASGGAIVEPSDVKKQTGWTAEVPPHQWENWIQNRQDNYLAHINQRGIPEWDGNTEYEAGGLSYVQGSDGKVYKSVAASGPASVVSDPTTDVTDTYWTVAFADVGAFLTQTAGDTRYTQRSNNLSDLINTAAARANLALGTAATANLTTSNVDGTAGRVLKVGDGGWMGQGSQDGTPYGYPSSVSAVTNQTKVIRATVPDNGVVEYSAGIHFAAVDSWGRLRVGYSSQSAWIQGGLATSGTGWTDRVILSSNLLQTTGTSDVFPMTQRAVTGQLLGVGQTWQNVTGSRAIGTTYTNTTGRAIVVSVNNNSGTTSVLTVGGVQVGRVGQYTGGEGYQLCAVVPNGATYVYTGAGIQNWAELR